MILATGQAQAIHFLDILGLGGSDGNITKIKYRLRENFLPTDVVWSEDGNYIATSGTPLDEIHIWDVKNNKIIKKLHAPFPEGTNKQMVFTADGRYLAFCPGYREIPLVIYNITSGEIVKKFTGKDKIACYKIAISFDGKEIFTVGNRSISIINIENFSIINQFDIPNTLLYSIKDASWLTDNKNIIVGSDGNYEKIDGEERKPVSRLFKVNINSQKILNNVIAYGSPYFSDITTVATSPDGRLVATGTNSNVGGENNRIRSSVHFFDANNLNFLAAPMDGLIPTDGAIHGLDFSSNGKYLIVSHLDDRTSSIHIFDTQSLKLIDTAHSSAGVRALAVQKHGNLFAVASAQHIIIFELF